MLKNLGGTVSDSKNRVVILLVLVAVVLAVTFGFYGLKGKGEGVGAASRVSGAPAVESIPGVGEPSREYVKLQRAQNIEQAKKAAKTGTSSVPTIIRASYVGSDEFSTDGAAAADTDDACSVQSLRRARRAGVSAFELRCRGCSAKALRAAGYTAGELRAVGFSAKQLRDAGFNAAELRAAGLSAAELKAAGFSASELLSAGYTAGALRAAGFSAADLKAAGVSAEDLAAAGFGYAELRQAGLTAKELAAVGVAKDGDKKGNCNPEVLRKARAEGVKANELRARGCDATALRAAGFTAGELRDAGFSAAELIKDAGFSAAELKEAGFSARELRAAGFSAKDLLDAGFSVRALKDAGFTAGALKRAGVSAADLRAAGFSAKELRAAGFSAAELKATGFSAEALMAAGFSRGALMRAGFSARQLGMHSTGALDADDESGAQASTDPAHPTVDTAVKPDTVVGLDTGGGRSSPDAVLARLQRRQAQQLSRQERQQRVDQFQQGMGSQANELISSWAPPPTQQFVMGTEVKKSAAQSGALLPGTAGAAPESGIASILGGPKTSVKAGTIVFAILDTGINSDEDSPIMATVVQGPLKGAKLIGKFKRTSQKVVLSFDMISVPRLPKSLQVTAVAIDQNTARTAMADHVNNHYLLRYGTLFAASFVDGLAGAVAQSGTKVDTSTIAVSVNNEKLNNAKLGLIALGKVGKQYAASLGSSFTVPPTVKLNAGKGLGILFMQDLAFSTPALASEHRVIE